MKQYDLMILGPATRDVNIDYTGAVDRSCGGAVTFCTPAAVAAGAKVLAAVKISPDDRDILDTFRMNPADVALLPSHKTTIMRNEYFTPDRERRNSCCDAQSDPIIPAELPEASCRLYHLAGLLYGDFPNELIEYLHTKGMVFHDWKDKLTYLPYMNFLKTDAAEAEILTGCTDRVAAARKLYDWGAKEILISHNTEMLAYDGKRLCTCPVKARNLSGRTGRGDTTFGAYLAMRVTGADMEEALRYATACVSLKMETPGVFRGTRADVEEYRRLFY